LYLNKSSEVLRDGLHKHATFKQS